MENYKIYKNLKIIEEDKVFFGDIKFNNKFIKIDKDINEGNYIDYSDKIALSGFIDVHTHGAIGLDFSTIDSIEKIKKLLDFYASKGVTSLLPTLLTEKDSLIFHQEELLYEASLKLNQIKGLHLEGPFVSKEYKGAQLEEYLQVPSISKCEDFIKHSHNIFKYMTIAPELPNSLEVIEYLVKNNIRVTLGHSAASFKETENAIYKGATNFTHLMNAMKGINQHEPSILAAALYFKDTFNEVILDGIHVHPTMVEFIRKIKGDDKLIAITDSLMSAGLPNGDYFIGNTPITVKDGDCKIKGTNIRAGSTLTMDNAFKNIKKFCNLDDVRASHMTSLNAAKMLGLDDKIGSIKEGKNADFIIMDKEYNILEVYLNGERIY